MNGLSGGMVPSSRRRMLSGVVRRILRAHDSGPVPGGSPSCRAAVARTRCDDCRWRPCDIVRLVSCRPTAGQRVSLAAPAAVPGCGRSGWAVVRDVDVCFGGQVRDVSSALQACRARTGPWRPAWIEDAVLGDGIGQALGHECRRRKEGERPRLFQRLAQHHTEVALPDWNAIGPSGRGVGHWTGGGAAAPTAN